MVVLLVEGIARIRCKKRYCVVALQEAAILSYIDPLVAVLVSVTLLGESMTAMQVIGGSLILGFTLLNELSPVPKAKKE